MYTRVRSCLLFAELTVWAFAWCAAARGADWYVATNGIGDGTTWALATNNIQDAISLAGVGDTVWVSNGVYETGGVTNWPAGGLLTNRVAITNAITVRSANNNPTNTIIKGAWDSASTTNGPAAVRCVYMVNNSSLIGFMLTNGATIAGVSSSGGDGGGVLSQSTSAVISNCIIAGNRAYNCGAGAYLGTLYDCTLTGNMVRLFDPSAGGGAFQSTLSNCTLIGNAGAYGGGVWGPSTLYNCTLTGNSASLYGGGVAYNGILYNCTLISNTAGGYGGGGARNNCQLNNCTLIANSTTGPGGGTDISTLSNCTLRGNSAGTYGGGASMSTLYNCAMISNSANNNNGGGAATSTLYNCTVSGNSAKNGGGISGGTSVNSIIYFNTATTDGSNWYDTAVFTNSCTAPTTTVWAAGNITGDPMFVDTNTANYRLSANSPCINAGTNGSWTTNAVDLDGRIRIRYGTVDMGAYEIIYDGTIFRIGY